MKTEVDKESKFVNRLVPILMMLCTLAVLVFPVVGRTSNSEAMMGITVVNNSGRDILHLYLSPLDRDAWGPDLMSEGSVLASGQSFTINEATCTGNEIKVVAEDREGCFVYGVVSCAQATTSWTIVGDTPRDCGN